MWHISLVLHGGLRDPADTDRGLCDLGAVGQQSKVPRNHYPLSKLVVQRQLRVVVVTF